MRPTHSGTLLVAVLLGPSTLLTAAGDPGRLKGAGARWVAPTAVEVVGAALA